MKKKSSILLPSCATATRVVRYLMMTEFININKDKIRSFTLIAGVLCGLFILLIFSVIYDRAAYSIWLLIPLYILIVTIVTALFVIMLILIRWMEFRRKRDLFNQPNWNDYFAKYEFETVFTLQKERHMFTQEAKLGRIKGFVVVADFSEDKEKQDHFKFRFYVGNDSADKEEYRRLSKLLKNANGGLEFGYLYKYVRVDKNQTVLQIEQDVNQFADLLLANGLIPPA